MKQKTLFPLSAVVALLLAACNPQSNSQSTQMPNKQLPNPQTQDILSDTEKSKFAQLTTIGFAHCCVRGEIFTTDLLEDSIRHAATESGVKLLFATAEDSLNRDDLSVQPRQVKNMIDKGAKAIILISAQGKGAEQMQEEILEYAKSKGVPVVAAGRPLSPKLHTHFPDVISVGSSSEEAGTNQGKMAVDLWHKHPEWDLNKDGVLQYGLLQGAKDHPQTVARANYFMKAITAKGLKSERIATEHTNWERPVAQEIVAKWIATGEINKMEMIVGGSDDLAMGALDAFRDEFRRPVPILGINAFDETKRAIKKGNIAGSILQDIEAQGRVAYKIAENLALDKPATNGINLPLKTNSINIPYAVVTAENVDEYLKEEKRYGKKQGK